MQESKTYRLFLSHTWTYGCAYEKLVESFRAHPDFSWKNYSVPMHDPVHYGDDDTALYNAIKRRIALANCVIMLDGVYGSYPMWINQETMIAKVDYKKPIIVVEPIDFRSTSRIESILALRARIQTGCSLRGHRFFRNFCFSETLKNMSMKS